MSLSDDISKMDALAEGTCFKLFRQHEALKGSLQAFERRGQGNLMVRGLGDIVQEDDILDSEYMTTVMVVIQKSSMKEFLLEYERLA